jgi:hypothetical protein
MRVLLQEIIHQTNKDFKLIDFHAIQKLWSGYGQLIRATVSTDDETKSFIIKFIQPESNSGHPCGWNTDISHQRKIKSYQVEMNWYQNYNKSIDGAYYPKLITYGHNDDAQWIIMEDLRDHNFNTKAAINWKETKRCLSWLAKFHAYHLNKLPSQLWDIGTYWHLATRPDELAAIKDECLKSAALTIDERLNAARYKTIIHGDAKLANFLFNETHAAAVDFQYVGGGVGVKDVAYFLSSIYDEDELKTQEGPCLDYYFKELNNKDVELEWRELYPYAWCDFIRFLEGWSPNHYKINRYSQEIKKRVLSWI